MGEAFVLLWTLGWWWWWSLTLHRVLHLNFSPCMWTSGAIDTRCACWWMGNLDVCWRAHLPPVTEHQIFHHARWRMHVSRSHDGASCSSPQIKQFRQMLHNVVDRQGTADRSNLTSPCPYWTPQACHNHIHQKGPIQHFDHVLAFAAWVSNTANSSQAMKSQSIAHTVQSEMFD